MRLLHARMTWAPAAFLSIALSGAALNAQNDYYVNGATGQDLPSNGTSLATPWKTMTYALGQITPPTWPAQHTLHVAGGQTYSPATNGETFPIRPIYNVRILGDPGSPPVLALAAGQTGIVFDPATVFNRNQSKIDSLVLRGGATGIYMGGSAQIRHRPKIDRCAFEGQSGAGITIDERGLSICDPRFFQCSFRGPGIGIWATASGNAAVVRPDVEECRFEGLGGEGMRLEDLSGQGSDVGGLVRYCWFAGCRAGVALYSGTNAFMTRLEILACTFHECRRFGVFALVGRPADPMLSVSGCSFIGGEAGIHFEGNFAPGTYSLTARDNFARGTRHAGFEYLLNGTGQVRVISENNLAMDGLGDGHLAWVISPGITLVLDSLRDRALRNAAAGFEILQASPSSSSIQMYSCIAAQNGAEGLRLASAENVEARFLTLASNSGPGLLIAGATTGAQVDHCIFAANSPSEVQVPSGFPITWSCFQGQSFAGTGNIHADPRLHPTTWKLDPNSPCIDAGQVAARVPPFDFENDSRPLLGHLGGTGGPDMGADERRRGGNAVRYGTAGYGADAFHPTIASPTTGAAAGSNLTIELRDAIDFHGFLATAAALMIGLREDEGSLPLFALYGIGAPGSYLWQDAFTIPATVPVGGAGMGSALIPIPPVPALIGADLSAQWLVLKLGTNAASFVTTDALRVTIG